MKALARTQDGSDVGAPSDRAAGMIDPELIWFFDSSKQLLVFRDPAHGGRAAAWPESLVVKCGWNMNGIRSLPRVSVNG
jgi:hypothetical protein